MDHFLFSLLFCFGCILFRKRYFFFILNLIIFHHKVKVFVSSLSHFLTDKLDLCRIPMIDRICVEGCKHNSWIPKWHGCVAHLICHSRSETSHALGNIFTALSSPPRIKSFSVGINSVHQHSSFLTFNLKSVSLQQLGIYSTTYFSRVEDFLPVGRIQAKHTHELGELTHQTGNMLHTEGNLTHHTLAVSGTWLWKQKRPTLAAMTCVIIAAWWPSF